MPITPSRPEVFQVPARQILAHRVLGLPHPRKIVEAAEALIVAMMQQGYSKADIGRSLGFKDFVVRKTPRARQTIQNAFQIRAHKAGLKMPKQYAGARRKLPEDERLMVADIMIARAQRAKAALEALLAQNMTRDAVIVKLSAQYSQSELARLLGLSRGRINQIVKP